jgi:hypothetical protein
MIDSLLDAPIWSGIVGALLGVGFWIAGPVIAYLVWERYRGSGQE